MGGRFAADRLKRQNKIKQEDENMIRSMYSGVAGMRSNQTKMDVIGNNIANVNTNAFKANRVRFQDSLYQTQAYAEAPTAGGRGGTNPQQIGQGVTVAAIDTLFGNGPLQPTGRDLDFGIDGEGFFIVSPDENGDVRRFTRDGVFYKDTESYLVNAEGYWLGVSNFDLNDPDMPLQTAPPDIQADGSNLGRLRIPDTITDAAGDVYRLETFYMTGSRLISAVTATARYIIPAELPCGISQCGRAGKTGRQQLRGYPKLRKSGIRQRRSGRPGHSAPGQPGDVQRGSGP